MEMEDAAGTITQVLSVFARTPVPDKSVRPALENGLNRKSDLVRNPQLGSSITRTSLHHTPRKTSGLY